MITCYVGEGSRCIGDAVHGAQGEVSGGVDGDHRTGDGDLGVAAADSGKRGGAGGIRVDGDVAAPGGHIFIEGDRR